MAVKVPMVLAASLLVVGSNVMGGTLWCRRGSAFRNQLQRNDGAGCSLGKVLHAMRHSLAVPSISFILTWVSVWVSPTRDVGAVGSAGVAITAGGQTD